MTPDPIRVLVVQPALPKYRIPVFKALASREGLAVRVWYGDTGKITNAEPEGFDAELRPQRQLRGGIVLAGPQWRACSRREADVVVMPWNTRHAPMYAGLFRARLGGARVILWGHGYSKREAGWRATLRRLSGKLASAVMTYNRTAATALVEAGFDARRVFTALNALDQSAIQAARSAWRDDPDRLDAFRREHRLGEHAPGASKERPGGVLLFVSRLHSDNRVDRLLDAAASLRERHPGVVVAIIGKGPALDGLRAHADRLELGGTVRFLGAIYGEHDIAPWFCSANAFCYPENIGLSILHAMGYGLPVVTSDKREAQNPEIEALQHDVNGLTYAHGDQDALNAALDRLLRDHALRDRLAAAAQHTATEEFSIENMVDGFEQAVRSVVSPPVRP